MVASRTRRDYKRSLLPDLFVVLEAISGCKPCPFYVLGCRGSRVQHELAERHVASKLNASASIALA